MINLLSALLLLDSHLLIIPLLLSIHQDIVIVLFFNLLHLQWDSLYFNWLSVPHFWFYLNIIILNSFCKLRVAFSCLRLRLHARSKRNNMLTSLNWKFRIQCKPLFILNQHQSTKLWIMVSKIETLIVKSNYTMNPARRYIIEFNITLCTSSNFETSLFICGS